MSGADECHPGYRAPNHLAGFFSDADILAKRHELSKSKEDRHRLEIDELHAKICELEDATLADEENQSDQLQKLTVTETRLQGKMEAARRQYEGCISDVGEQFMLEREQHLSELDELKQALKRDQDERNKKDEEITAMEAKQEHGLEKRAREQEYLREQIKKTIVDLNKLIGDHERVRRAHFEKTTEKARAYVDDKDRLRSQIQAVRVEVQRENREFALKEMQLQKDKQAMSAQQHNDRAEMELRFGPLLLEKEDLEARIEFLEDKIEERKENEKKKCAAIVQRFNKIFSDRALNFEREKTDILRQAEDKEEDLIEKESELFRVRTQHDMKIRKLNERIDNRTKEMDRQIMTQNEQHNNQLAMVTNRIRHKSIDDEIHAKRCALLRLEAQQEVEEALLLSRLKTLTDKERNYREALNTRQMKQADLIASLDHKLSFARTKKDTEQKQFDTIKEQLDTAAFEARVTMEDDIKDALVKLNEVSTEVCNVQKKISDRQAITEEKKEKTERKISDELARLGFLKETLEEKIPPLQERHNEVRQRMKDDKTRHDIYMKNLLLEQEAIEHEHDTELGRLHDIQDSTREEQANELDKMADVLKGIQESNDLLQEKHEVEMFNLNLKLVEALDESSPEAVGKLKNLKDLQAEHREKTSKFERLKLDHLKDSQKTDFGHESEKRRLKATIHDLNKQLIKDGITDAEERKHRIEELLKKKNISFRSDSLSSCVLDSLEEATSKNLELKEKYESKKKDFQELRSQRQKEISVISNQLSNVDHKETYDGRTVYHYNAQPVQCVLDELINAGDQTEEDDYK